MTPTTPSLPTAGLLVSVRTPQEAAAALAGGAAVIDVKEPSAGPLGAPSAPVIRAVVAEVAGAQPVTAAFGELAELDREAVRSLRGSGLTAVKLGLRGASKGWPRELVRLQTDLGNHAAVVPAVYAEGVAVATPTPEAVISAAADHGFHRLVIDTWDKRPQAPGLLGVLEKPRLVEILQVARQHRIALVLAGKLSESAAVEAVRIGHEVGGDVLVGVRGAVCRGERSGTVSQAAVERLASAIRRSLLASAPS